jgi:hypothetical protein
LEDRDRLLKEAEELEGEIEEIKKPIALHCARYEILQLLEQKEEELEREEMLLTQERRPH